MKKVELVKKLISFGLVILYDVVSLLFCYVLLNELFYTFSVASSNENGMTIIGGAGIPTLMFIVAKGLRFVFPIIFIVFILLSITTVILLTVLSFKEQINQKLHILLCLFSALSLILFILIPIQMYVIPWYVLFKKLSFFKYLPTLYIVLSVVINVKCVLFAVKRKGEKNERNL